MNYMKQIAEMLGVELGEKFKIDGFEGNFRLSENSGIVHDYGGLVDGLLIRILTGKEEITKLPWKPKRGGMYYYVRVDGGTVSEVWDNHTFDIMHYLVGNCFRTETEAEAHKDEMLTKMKEVIGGNETNNPQQRRYGITTYKHNNRICV